MSVITREELLERIRERIGDDTSDDALALLDDVTDTIDDYDRRVSESGDWETKYHENDAQWRERYKNRFFGKVNDDDFVLGEGEIIKEDIEKTKFEDLFE